MGRTPEVLPHLGALTNFDEGRIRAFFLTKITAVREASRLCNLKTKIIPIHVYYRKTITSKITRVGKVFVTCFAKLCANFDLCPLITVSL
jgi:hypothetical protein